ncbi:hypothetical protein DTO063F5_939 [Paecilomyces variotii]|nr:hypothetical protein DTO063F5_939 [Paecilomyces variotii]
MLSIRLQRTCVLRAGFIRHSASRLTTTRSRSKTTGVDTKASDSKESSNRQTSTSQDSKTDAEKKMKTMADLDDELRQKLENMSGEGGASGLEYENGKPVAMKRSVRNNMFRYI